MTCLHRLLAAQVFKAFPSCPFLFPLKVEEAWLGGVARALVGLLEARVEVEQVRAVQLAGDASQIGGSFFEIFSKFGIGHDDSA